MSNRPACGPALTATVFCAVLLPALAWAEPAPAAPPADSPATAAAPASDRRGGEPAVEHLVSEDDNVRIEELRVRGQTQRITVKSKTGGGSRYEILTGDGGRDPSQDKDKRAIGQRVWQVFSF